MNRLTAYFFSFVAHPILIPIYGLILILQYTYLVAIDSHTKWYFFAVVSLFTAVLPLFVVLVMRLMGYIHSLSLRNLKERRLPYLSAHVFYVILLFLLIRLNMPSWIINLFIGAVLSLFFVFLISFYWKISAHMTGIGGLIGAIMYVSQSFYLLSPPLLIIVFLLAGIVGTSRLWLDSHTLPQLLVGFLNGIFCLWGVTFLLDKFIN